MRGLMSPFFNVNITSKAVNQALTGLITPGSTINLFVANIAARFCKLTNDGGHRGASAEPFD